MKIVCSIQNKLTTQKLTTEKTKFFEKLTTLIENKSSLAEFRIVAKNVLGLELYPKPQKKLISRILHDLHLSAGIQRFTNLVFKPYSTHNINISKNALNTFSGFPLLNYKPKKIVNVENTTIWRYLFEVVNFSQPDCLQMNYILDFLAWKLQYPARRSGRIWCIVAKTQGIGKSSFFHLCEMIFSKDHTLFHYNLDSLTCRFNQMNSSK